MNYKVYVTKKALSAAYHFLRNNHIEYTVIDDESQIEGNEKCIIFTINKGHFVTPCPGTPRYICCGYYIVSPVENCPYRCTYCILNAYFKDNHIRVFTNTDKMIEELTNLTLTKNIRRIGTGEFSDSMFTPFMNFYIESLIEFFNKHNDLFLELKTKNHLIPDFLFKTKNKNIIFSWSLNSEKITSHEEGGTSPILLRLNSAKTAISHGYPVSFHFDPIIEYEGWQRHYEKTIETLFKFVPSKSILWISLGTLRFIPSLKEKAKTLYPETKIFRHEFIKGLDGKNRYFRKKRVEIYSYILSKIREFSKDVFVYLCMENEDVWDDVFGVKMTTKKLKALMDAQLYR